MKKKRNKILPFKHYFYIIVSIVVVFFVAWYIISWYNAIQENRLATSYLVASNTISLEIKDTKEVPSVLKETPSNYFVFISYTGDNNEYNLEKKLKKIIDNNNISDKFYYLDITDNIKDDNLISYLNKLFETELISSIPCILYYEDGKLNTVIQNNTKIFDANKFQELLNTINNID